jgi:hypothetical protein
VGDGGRAAARVAVGCPGLLAMLSVLECSTADAHNFAQARGGVRAVTGRVASRMCRRFRWTSCQRRCSSLQTLPRMQRRSAESLGAKVGGVKLGMIVNRCKTEAGGQTYRWCA